MPRHLVEHILTPEDKRYRRCLGFGCCHIRTCVFIVGILELIALAAAVVTLFVLYELTAESFMNRSLPDKQRLAPGTKEKKELQLITDSPGSDNLITDTTLADNRSMNYFERGNMSRKSIRISHHQDDESSESSEEKDGESSSEEEMEKEKDLIYMRAKHRYYVRSMVGAAVAFVIGVFVVALMFTGLVKRRSHLLLPHLGVQILAMIGLVIIIILYSVWCASGDETAEAKRHYPINQSISCYLIIVSCTIAFILEVFSFLSVIVCYRYLRDVAQFERDHSDTHRFLSPYLHHSNGKGNPNVTKWTHLSPNAPGALVPGKRV